ncbi:hypothetical protein BKA62DRAFT_437921 [Auriculariales sp. MPI-PUGE-AT-0066]|nr:hypothetical protein BKA62DRAFT_437921 [Auriculariales sp. MPI-PUGE-AT-0066]
MAQFGYQSQSRDLLVFGQAIQVGEQSVRVERHLSQGGFAHVYLVRTDKPVGGTTQHVLKHIRVAQESMLNEVRKEVDIMRLLRGHPNIVHLIDAAWSKQPNGIFEVFILMEFCAGGGIIDMMNRRLRERLTEAEILQIFVDVCEGLALMHNLRPALLHRDLKVENILQSSATKYKLCDFGSATPVSARPPSTVAEVQALAHDLDRHTTLQYRAPEMIDPNLRRPIDEKSDVWALGVLLYKLCYYTTPFEEHGPLAILNVQYSFPQYPVYSAQMNALIRSMLQEYGTYRPSVYDLLTTVHAMRGTRSQYSYNRPPAPAIAPGPPPVSSLDDILVKRKQQAAANQPAAGGAAAARQQVLDAIAPMRRGRPETQDERAWETAKADAAQGTSAPSRDAWEINLKRVEAKSPAVVSPTAGNSFADSFKPSILNAHVPPPIKSPLNTAYQQSPASKSISPPSLAGLTSAPAAILRAPSAPLQTPRLPPSSVSPGPSAVRSPPLDDSSLSAEERFPSLEALDAAFSDSGSAAAPPASRPGPGASEPSFKDHFPNSALDTISTCTELEVHKSLALQCAMTRSQSRLPLPRYRMHRQVSSSPPTSPRPMLRRHRSSVAIKSPVVARQSVVQQHENIVGPALAPNLPPRPVPVPAPQQDWLTGEFDEPHMAQAPAFGRTGKSSLEGPRAMGSRPASMSASMSAKPLSTERMSSPKPPLPPRRPASPVDILEEAKNRFKPPSPIPGSSFDFSRSKLEATKLEPLRLSPALRRASPKPTGLTDNWSPVEAKHPHRRSSTGSSSSEDEPPEDISQGRRSVLAPKARKTKIRPKGKSGSIHDLVDLWSPGANDSSSTATKGLELPAASTGHYQRPSSGGRSDMGSRLERSPSSQAQKWNADPSPILQPSAVPPASSPAKTRPQSMFLYGSNSGGTPSHSPSTLPQVQQQYQQQQANKYSALHHQTSYTSLATSITPKPLASMATPKPATSNTTDWCTRQAFDNRCRESCAEKPDWPRPWTTGVD